MKPRAWGTRNIIEGGDVPISVMLTKEEAAL
jgi:hypothetical protein